MYKVTPNSASLPAFFSRQRVGLLSCVRGLTLLLIAAGSAWATPKESAELTAPQVDYSGVARAIAPYLSSTESRQGAEEYPAEVMRTIEAYPDVVVFPIQVATNVGVAAGKKIANKIAQASIEGNIAVIYPDIGEPYRSIFAQIIGGIESKTKRRVANFALAPNVDVDQLNKTLLSQNTRVVIALGRQGVKVASTLDSEIGVVMAGVLTATDDEIRDYEVNSLAPDPALLFARLKGMMPGVRRIFTIYDPRQNAWMMKLAKDSAHNLGMELVAYEAQDLHAAMKDYQTIFATAESKRDALWLPQDSTTVEDSTVVPMVLQESWSHNLAVFSSSFGHVRRGVLFSLYPNNEEFGRHLGGSALGYLANGENEATGMLPLREVLMAINLRTAKHLGVNTERQQSFDTTFPEQ